MRDKKLITIFIVLGIIFTILGSTFAYWNWSSTNAQKTLVTFTVTPGLTCSADGGGNITNANYFAPATCTNSTYALQREISVSTDTDIENAIISLDLYLNVNSIGQPLLNTDYFMYALTEEANSCADPISGGSFKENYDSTNQRVPLLTEEEFIGSETKTYYLYIWLDEAETDLSTMNQSVSLSLGGECSDTGNVFNKLYAYLGNSGVYYKAAAYRANITSVSFVNNIDIPSGATNWSVGVSPSNAADVKAWLEDAGNGKKSLKIGGNGVIFAENLAQAFYNLSNATNFDLRTLNTSETTNMANMFEGVGRNASAFNLNLGNHFYVSNVDNMGGMFYYAGENVTDWSLNVGNNFNAHNVTNMYYMFKNAGRNAVNWNLNLSPHFDTSSVTVMSYMFYAVGDSSTNFNLNLGSEFNTSSVRVMALMFYNAGRNATNFNINLGTQFNTSSVTTMASMFESAGNRTTKNFTLDISAGNFTSVTNMKNMFTGFPTSKATIYVKDATAQSWVIARNNGFSATNVLIK